MLHLRSGFLIAEGFDLNCLHAHDVNRSWKMMFRSNTELNGRVYIGGG